MLFSLTGFVLAPLWLQRSQLDLTPPEMLPLGGYTKRGGKLADPGGETLYSRVAVLSQGELRVAVVSVEMLTVPESLVREVLKQIPSDLKLFMVATHTHCAPDSQMLNDRMTMAIPGIASYREKWLDWFAARISLSVNAALEARRERIYRVDVAQFEPKLNRSRRPQGAPYPWATRVDTNGRPLFYVYAAHATVYDDKRNQPAGDWPGEVMRRTGAIVLPGAIGDCSPAASMGDVKGFVDRFLSAQRASPIGVEPGMQRAPAAWSELRGANSLASAGNSATRLSFTSVPIALGEPDLHPEFPKANGIPESLARILLNRFAPREASVSTLSIGALQLIGIPGEPTSHVGRSVSAGDEKRVPISHCNGWIGYIVDPTDYWLGGYEATLTMFGPLTSVRVVNATK